MLTRAKSLEIVVGNPDTLKQDPFWRKFINYCARNGAVNGSQSNELLDFEQQMSLLRL